MEKSIDNVVTKASYIMVANMYVITEMIEQKTGLGKDEAMAMAIFMFDKKSKEINVAVGFSEKILDKYIAECKRHLFSEDKENE